MRRKLTGTLILLAISGLSLDFGATTRGDAPSGLPHVSAAFTNGAATIEGTETPAPDMSRAAFAVAIGPDPVSAEEVILQALRNRHTGLADSELVQLARTIVEEAERNQLDPQLVMAVIQVESRGYHLAVSPVGALGLMQLLPSTAEELAQRHGVTWRGPNSLFDPAVNVRLGTAYLRQLSTKYGSMSTALAAYNWGPGRIDRRMRRGASVPSRYINQVMKFYEAGERPLRTASSS